jgi:hypothetical protein
LAAAAAAAAAVAAAALQQCEIVCLSRWTLVQAETTEIKEAELQASQ